MAKRHRMERYARLLLADLDAAAEGGGMMASLCAEAADRIRKQDQRIIMLRKMLSRRRKSAASLAEGEAN